VPSGGASALRAPALAGTGCHMVPGAVALRALCTAPSSLEGCWRCRACPGCSMVPAACIPSQEAVVVASKNLMMSLAR
jgi:hypothetical protein